MRIDALVRAVAGSDEPAAILRAQCVRGIIQTATFAPDGVDFDPGGLPTPRRSAARLTDEQRDFALAAAHIH